MNKLFRFYFVALTLLSSKAFADEYHYVNVFNGSKAAGLGGAYTAIADDLSAMLYNPAGLSLSTVKSTASVNIFSQEETEFSNVFSDGSDFTRDSFVIIPGFFAFRKKEGDWDFGLSFAISDLSKERTSTDVITNIEQSEFQPSQRNNEFIYIDLDNSAYKLGVTSSFRYSDSLSFGSSLYIQYKEFTTVQGSGIISSVFTPYGNFEGGFNASRRIIDLQVSVQPILGVLWKKGNVSLGGKLGYEIPIRRDYEATATILFSSPEPLPPELTPAFRVTEKTKVKQDLPFELAVGASYKFSDVLLTADVNYYSEVNTSGKSLEFIDTPITRKLNEVINWSVGVEYEYSTDITIRFGVFTDKSNGDIDINIDNQRIEDIDLLGFSTSLRTVFFKNIVTFGLYYKYGKGDVRFADIRSVEQIVGIPLYPDNGNYDIAEAKKNSLVLFLSLDF
jgi:long-chain fatty acid transport protein